MIESNFLDHDKEYTDEYLSNILKSVKTIAMIGASSDPTKFSYGVLRVLHETGYKMIPVNPKEAGNKIRGLDVTIVTSSKNKTGTIELLKEFNFPLNDKQN